MPHARTAFINMLWFQAKMLNRINFYYLVSKTFPVPMPPFVLILSIIQQQLRQSIGGGVGLLKNRNVSKK